MKKLISLSVAALIGSLAFLLPHEANAQTDTRLSRIETPPSTQWASNATTVFLDFKNIIPAGSTNYAGNPAPVRDYTITDLSGNLTMILTNLEADRTARFVIDTDGSARNITISTNGITTGCEILFPYSAVNTNGSSSFTVTNRSWGEVKISPNKKFALVNFWHAR